ncbi:hypothetical protein [Roseivivax sp. THAF30]|uniref:hypothetical protein n=1 Tax=Roseivivax sp. THAF30 TaxID=2587852 RepID=UPI0012A92231|nr:hypothetical protein [Roseivivax sp. THAF30]QFT62941.1 hypothetical protein FIU91_08410 [Roseivivax sp. THAF30]
MDVGFIVPILALFTLLAVTILGIKGKFEVERAKADPKDPNSTLAADGPNKR